MTNNNITEFEKLKIMENDEEYKAVQETTSSNANDVKKDTRLLPFSTEVTEMILMHLDFNNIRIISEEYVSEYVWLRKKNKTIKEAVLNGNLIGLKYLIKNQNINIHSISSLALQLSAMFGYLDIFYFLVENGADIHINNDIALRLSAKYGHLEIVKYLIDHDADIHANNEDPLLWSAQNGQLEIVKYLVEGVVTSGKAIQEVNIHAYREEALQLSAQNSHLEVLK